MDCDSARHRPMRPPDGDGIFLPYDVLVEILSRLPCLTLTDCRRVCRAWRSIVDANNLLLPHFFPPRAFPGVFINVYGFRHDSYFFAPPCGANNKPGFQRPLFRHGWATIRHSCNGLLLLSDDNGQYIEKVTFVCNPATMRYDLLPCPPELWRCDGDEGTFLTFDPAVSLHYHVFRILKNRLYDTNVSRSAAELNAQTVNSLVFSSRTGEWVDRKFMPGSCLQRHLHEAVDVSPWGRKWSAEYWRGSLYVNCDNGVLMILRCSEETYDMVQLPGEASDFAEYKHTLPQRSLLTSYERGVRYVALKKSLIHVWKLSEAANGQLTWMLAHEANLNALAHTMLMKTFTTQTTMTWELTKHNSRLVSLFKQDRGEKSVSDQEKGLDDTTNDGHVELSGHSWNSDEHNFIEVDKLCIDVETLLREFGIMGFHPHKDAVLLHFRGMVVVYHLDTLRFQYLGDAHIVTTRGKSRDITDAFPYRPCYVDVLPTTKTSCPRHVYAQDWF